jgi:hypothetical protein
MIELANVESDTATGALEILESVLIVQLDTFHDSGKGKFKKQADEVIKLHGQHHDMI